MGWIQRIWNSVKWEPIVPFVDEETKSEDKVSVKDLLKFMEKQSEQNTVLISSVLAASVAQSETLKNYIDLFKPRYQESTTLEQRDAMRQERTDVRKSEWEGIDSPAMFKEILGGVPPEPSEY